MSTTRRSVALALLLALAAGPAYGLFVRPTLLTIPVSRLVDNLEQLVAQKPKDATLRYNLARVHAMAYAQKTDKVQVFQGREQQGAWFGFTPKFVPFQVKEAKTDEQKKAAQEHLDKALKRYEEIPESSDKYLAARLGHAWLSEQAGKKDQAIDEYRKVIKSAWESEGKRQTGPLGGNFLTVEAAGYLIPLLDKKNDADEIQTLQERAERLKKLPRPVTPVVVPLRDGLTVADLVDHKARVPFDADGLGLDGSWTWITKDAAWLVHDPRHTGKIDSALQMFGNAALWLFWDNGYQAMQALDDNRDGFLAGSELQDLALWHDANANGISEPGEVKSLAQWGIEKLSCRFETGSSPDCAAHSPAGVFFTSGVVRPTFDVILQKR